MAIAATGAVSFSDLRSEFVGGSSAISYSDLYRGGSNIRAKAANNTGVNLAASVPTSGTINITNFRSQAKGFRFTFSATATNQNASTLFGSDYGVNYPKEIVIDSGVELGATSTSEEALEIDSGGAGTITVTNNGTLTGAGGAVGAAGGDAFEAAVNCTFVNNGTVRAGGGGGGTGGNGSFTSYVTRYNSSNRWITRPDSKCCSVLYVQWNGVYVYNQCNRAHLTSVSSYSRQSYVSQNGVNCENETQYQYFYQVRGPQSSSTSGGSGGVGAGYNQSAGSGVAGGTNAGTGGTGGAFGATGSTGANGNSSNGSVGAAGGKYLRGSSFVTFTNNGTVQGGTA